MARQVVKISKILLHYMLQGWGFHCPQPVILAHYPLDPSPSSAIYLLFCLGFLFGKPPLHHQDAGQPAIERSTAETVSTPNAQPIVPGGEGEFPKKKWERTIPTQKETTQKTKERNTVQEKKK
jgi:hypothetical protein